MMVGSLQFFSIAPGTRRRSVFYFFKRPSHTQTIIITVGRPTPRVYGRVRVCVHTCYLSTNYYDGVYTLNTELVCLLYVNARNFVRSRPRFGFTDFHSGSCRPHFFTCASTG